MKRLALIGALLLISALAAGQAFGGASFQTIDPTATLGKKGRAVHVSGPVGCSQVEQVRIRATVTQRTTAALAVGHFKDNTCTVGTGGRWAATAKARGGKRFQPGAAEACGLLITKKNGKRTDAHQWCKDVTLVAGPKK